MAATVGGLRVTLGANTANFEAGMRRARREAQESATAIQRSLNGIKGAIGGLATGIVGGLSAGLLGGLANRALEYASSLGEVSQQLGVTTKDLQVLRYAASQVGVSQEEMDKGLQKLTVTMGQLAVGAQAPAKALEGLQKGLSEAVKGKDTGEQLRLIAEALSKVEDRSKRAAVEVALFGRTGAKLDTLLVGGRKGIDELAESAEKLGLVLSDEQIQRADETADKLSALKQVLEARIAGIVADNAESILSLATSLASLAAGLAKFWAQDPSRALGIIGALGGGMVGARFGPVGAAVGTVGGLALGRYLGSQNPKGMRDQADMFRRQAGQIARSKGYFRPGITQAEKEAISKDPGIQANLKQYRAYMAKAMAMDASASIAAPIPNGPTPDGDVGNFLAGGGGGRKGRSGAGDAERKRKEALRDAAERDRALADAKADELEAQKALMVDYVERAEIDRQLIDIQTDQQNAQLDLAVKLGDLDAVTAEQLKASNERLRILKKQEVGEQVELDRQRDFEQSEQQRFGLQRDRLQAESALATTAAERRRIEMQILELAYRERKERLERIIAESKDEEARRRAQEELAALPEQRRLDEEGVIAGTRGPLDDYLARIPKTPGEINERVEGLVVEQLDSVRQGINNALSKALGTKDPVILGLLDLLLQQILFRPIAEALRRATPSGGGGGGLGTIFSAIGSAVSAAFGGGISSSAVQSVSGDAAAMVAANPNVFASGGYTGDMAPHKVAGLVHGREFVFDAAATRRYGVGNLEALRRGSAPALRERSNPRPMRLEFNNDFRGADPTAVAAIQARLDRMQSELPGRVVAVVQDAKQRFILR